MTQCRVVVNSNNDYFEQSPIITTGHNSLFVCFILFVFHLFVPFVVTLWANKFNPNERLLKGFGISLFCCSLIRCNASELKKYSRCKNTFFLSTWQCHAVFAI